MNNQVSGNKDEPLVSVIMSTYNDEKYIRTAIESILNQTYHNIELIIVNDASTDKTAEILDKYNKEIVLISNNENKKLAYSLNLAISRSTGKYLVRMDADDISLPNRIEYLVRYMEENSDVDICGSYAQAIGSANILMTYPLGHEEIKAQLLFENAICHPSVVFRKSTMDYIYDPEIAASQDYDLWTRIIWNKRFANVPDPLIKYRIHQNQTRFKNGTRQKEGAVKARLRMIHSLEIYDDDFFSDMCVYDRPRSVNELLMIENFLELIIEKNSIKRVFDDAALRASADHLYYMNWYCSLGQNGISIKNIINSDFTNTYNSQSAFAKLKLLIHGLQFRIRNKY